MSFIRAKEIPPGSGNWYDYEVETVREGGKVIQRHIRYIGKSSGGPLTTGGGGGTGTATRTKAKAPVSPLNSGRIPKMKTPAPQEIGQTGQASSGR